MKAKKSISSQDLACFFKDCAPVVPVADSKAKSSTRNRFPPSEELESFFSDLDFRLEIQRKTELQTNRYLAGKFSVFPFIEPDENKLSRILAMLLDPRGAHGQQELFLKLFVAGLKRNSETNLQNAKVVQEAITSNLSRNRRIDILVTTGIFALAIENKVESDEQEDQLKDYHEHLKKLNKEDYCLVFLTPARRELISIPDEMASTLRKKKNLIEMTYREIREWLEECRRWCEAEKMRQFLADFIQYVDLHLLRDKPEAE